MNKLFPIYTRVLEPQYERPYYTNEWEPIVSKLSIFPDFQYTRLNTAYFYCGQVINGIETNVTSSFRSGTELIHTWTASGYATLTYVASDYTITSLAFTSDYPTQDITSNNISLTAGDFLNFRIEAGSLPGSGDVIHILFRKGTSTLFTDVYHYGKNEIAYKAPSTGTDYNIRIISVTVSGPGSGFTDALYSCMKCKYEIHNDYLTYYGGTLYTPLTAGICTFTFQSSPTRYSDVCLLTNDLTVFNERILIKIFSTYVDYADIYYQGGFIQSLYRYANVRRSPEPKITVIGDERNGVIVQEKVITATRYSVTIKCSEEQMDAFTTAAGATILITDQTGRTFTVYNLEISKPDWYRTNGLVTLTFDDNINTYTQNQTAL